MHKHFLAPAGGRHYLTVGQSRIYALDNPVGDAFGGPAFGQRNMPVVAIAMAAGSFAAGATAIAAGATGFAAVAAGAMMVGGALTIVGTVTGNAKLAKIGGILSLAGGIGTMANNMMTATDAAATAGSAASETAATTGVDAAASSGADAAATGAAGSTGEAVTTSVATPSAEILSTGDAVTAAQPAAASQSGSLIESANGATSLADLQAGEPFKQSAFATNTDPLSSFNTNNAFDSGILDPSSSLSGQSTLAADAMTTGMPDSLIGSTMPGQFRQGTYGSLIDGAGSASSPGYLERFQSWVKANPGLAKEGFSLVKGVAGNLVTSPKDRAEIEYANAKAEEMRRKARWSSGRI